MTPSRLPDWEALLDTAIGEASARPFGWGTQHDCCKAASCVVLAITGEDPMKEVPEYDSEMGARKALKLMGRRKIPKAIDSIFGKPIPVSWAQRGDVVFARLKGSGFAVNSGAGICLGRVSAFPGDVGWIFLPTSEASFAWPIGRTVARPPRKRAAN